MAPNNELIRSLFVQLNENETQRSLFVSYLVDISLEDLDTLRFRFICRNLTQSKKSINPQPIISRYAMQLKIVIPNVVLLLLFELHKDVNQYYEFALFKLLEILKMKENLSYSSCDGCISRSSLCLYMLDD